jgi:hypothetical protein
LLYNNIKVDYNVFDKIIIQGEKIMSIPFVMNPIGGFQAIVEVRPGKSKSFLIAADHPHFDGLREAIVDGNDSKFVELVDLVAPFRDYVSSDVGDVSVKAGIVYYKDRALHSVISARIRQMMDKGFPFVPMLRFINNMYQNPSFRAVNELYTFMIKKSHNSSGCYSPLPITEDGFLIAYKGLNADYTDCHTGTVNNKPPQRDENGELLPGEEQRIISMDRNMVNDDYGVDCGEGFHVGSLAYVDSFGSRIVVVKVNPKDVVSVPLDADCTKCRVCEYEVLYDYTGELKSLVYDSSAEEPVESHYDAPRVKSESEGRSNDDGLDFSPSPFTRAAYNCDEDDEDEDSYDNGYDYEDEDEDYDDEDSEY